MPKKIGPLVGAAKIHELVFESDRKIKKKNLPKRGILPVSEDQDWEDDCKEKR